MKALLTAKALCNKRVRFYLPDRYVPVIGHVDSRAAELIQAEGYDCLVCIDPDCKDCWFDLLYPASLLDGDPNDAKMIVENLNAT